MQSVGHAQPQQQLLSSISKVILHHVIYGESNSLFIILRGMILVHKHFWIPRLVSDMKKDVTSNAAS